MNGLQVVVLHCLVPIAVVHAYPSPEVDITVHPIGGNEGYTGYATSARYDRRGTEPTYDEGNPGSVDKNMNFDPLLYRGNKGPKILFSSDLVKVVGHDLDIPLDYNQENLKGINYEYPDDNLNASDNPQQDPRSVDYESEPTRLNNRDDGKNIHFRNSPEALSLNEDGKSSYYQSNGVPIKYDVNPRTLVKEIQADPVLHYAPPIPILIELPADPMARHDYETTPSVYDSMVQRFTGHKNIIEKPVIAQRLSDNPGEYNNIYSKSAAFDGNSEEVSYRPVYGRNGGYNGHAGYIKKRIHTSPVYDYY